MQRKVDTSELRSLCGELERNPREKSESSDYRGTRAWKKRKERKPFTHLKREKALSLRKKQEKAVVERGRKRGSRK